jgi:hypothetical protein
MSPTQEQFLAELESLGVGEVKERIARKLYAGGLLDAAQGWVDRMEAASNAEQLALTRQALTAAQRSNWIAIGGILNRGNLYGREHCSAIQTLIGERK